MENTVGGRTRTLFNIDMSESIKLRPEILYSHIITFKNLHTHTHIPDFCGCIQVGHAVLSSQEYIFLYFQLPIMKIMVHNLFFCPKLWRWQTFVMDIFACFHDWIITYLYIFLKYCQTCKVRGVLGYPTWYSKCGIPLRNLQMRFH